MTYPENWQHKKQQNSDLLKLFMKYFCQNKYSHVKTDVPEKRIYLTSQYDELLAVLVQIYEIWKNESNLYHDKFAVFPILLHISKIKCHV